MPVKVYSYIRFSSPDQAKGHSLERQLSYARSYAEKHNMLLDESLSMRDEGLSAYHQAHIKRGAFGIFLSAVQSDKVAPGSVLIVEALDRISRAEPIEAQAILSQIIMAGITVITASDNKVYERESLKKNPMDLVYSLLIFVRGNEESETKSRRVKASIIHQIEQWQKNGSGKIIRNGADPYWCKARADKSGFDLIPERVNIINTIIELYLKGYGYHKIVLYLNDNFTPFNNKQWYVRYIKTAVTSRTLIGERSFTVNDKLYIIKNYYPPVLNEIDFHNLQSTIKNRASTKSQGKHPSIITGMKISFCGLCGNPFISQNYSFMAKDNGLTDGYRRIRCSAHSNGSDCLNIKSISIVPIERAILEYCADQMELASVLGDSNKATDLRVNIVKLYRQADDIQLKIKTGEQSIVELLSQGQTVSPIINNMVEAFRLDHETIIKQIAALEDDVRYETRNDNRDIIEEWQSLKADVYGLNEDARLMIRQLVKRTFKRIEIFLHGMNHSNDPVHQLFKKSLATQDDTIDIILTFHNDKTRLLSIDKTSGSWVKGGDVNITEEGVPLSLAVHPSVDG